jgi:hypothetical protein
MTMKLATFRYLNGAWSRPFPDLDSERTMVLAFAAPSFEKRPELMIELAAAYPRAAMIGCSTAGEIDQTEIHDESITVAVVQFDRTRVRQAEARVASMSAYGAGVRIASELLTPELRAVLVLSPGTKVNGHELVTGLNARLPPRVIVTGGLAGDGDRFGRTWVAASGRIASDTVVAVGLYGDHVRVGHGSRGGWDAAGAERVVTRAQGNVLYALDDQPALALYKEHLGDRAAQLPESARMFPLSVRGAAEDGQGVLRAVVGVDEIAQSLTIAAEVPQGAHARLMRPSREELVLGAQGAGLAAALGRFEGPVLCVAISCIGRRLLLGEHSGAETEATLESLPVGTAQVGFYSYGEIAPHPSGRCDLHNQTMTLTVLGETA